MLVRLTVLCVVIGLTCADLTPVLGTKCARNQVVTKLTVYEDGSVEAECGPIPCGGSGSKCIDDQTTCKAETDVFSGMRWAANGQSLLLRCCKLESNKKVYVGTDIVTIGSYYKGGLIEEKSKYQQGGPEMDFIANARTEQGGVRIWVYRIMCSVGEETAELPIIKTTAEPPKETTTSTTTAAPEEETEEGGEEGEEEETEVEEQSDAEPQHVQQEEPAFNPLRYRPPHLRRASTGRV